MDGNSLTPQQIKLAELKKIFPEAFSENRVVLMLEQATQEIVDAILKNNRLKVIALDKLFNGNDQLKTNTTLQFKDVGIEFRTI